MRIKAFYGALLSVVLAFATLVGIASPANAATTDVASSSWNLKSNSAATSVSDFTAGKVWRFSGTVVEKGSSIRYNTAVTGANGTAVDAVQITHTNCYGNGATVTAVSASGGSVTYTTNRAQYTCGHVNNTFPKLDATGKWGGNDLVAGDPVRRVRITLHN